MTRKILVAVLLAGWFGPSAMGDPAKNVKQTFRLDLSALHTMKTQDWSGRAKISKGRITKVEKTSGAMDTIHPDTIRRVDVIKNGNYIWTKNPKAKSLQVTFQDMDVRPGKAYYYVRVFQRDPEKPDGDSEIAWSSPIFVTFK